MDGIVPGQGMSCVFRDMAERRGECATGEETENRLFGLFVALLEL